MPSEIVIQKALNTPHCPNDTILTQCLTHVLDYHHRQHGLTLRMVDEAEMSELNQRYRHKDGPTNVLSFPADFPPHCQEIPSYLGDLVICWPVMRLEAQKQNKTLAAHLTHLLIHGCLHLLGYNHENDEDANTMEQLEIQLLAEQGYANPYGDRIPS